MAGLAHYSWALWLATPVVATGAAAAHAWWRGRPVKAPSADRAVREHRDYLDALGRASAGALAAEARAAKDRPPRPG